MTQSVLVSKSFHAVSLPTHAVPSPHSDVKDFMWKSGMLPCHCEEDGPHIRTFEKERLACQALLEVWLNPFVNHGSDPVFETQHRPSSSCQKMSLISNGQVPIEHVQIILLASPTPSVRFERPRKGSALPWRHIHGDCFVQTNHLFSDVKIS